ncbi:MAG TPA: methyltransferase domain-containing protein, partial [Blastocatellia bacterium]|nr:methyltransferase domain-containing protein [Blastocatellia bacterium]
GTYAPAIRTEELPACLLCERRGEAFYSNVQDRMFGTPGVWSFSKCPGCGLVWLNPRPIREDIPRCYENFYTHDRFVPAETVEIKSRVRLVRETLRELILSGQFNYPRPEMDRWWTKAAGKALATLPPLRHRATYGLDVMCPPYIGRGELLDVGCGNGSYLYAARRLGWKVTGIDIDPVAARITEESLNISVIVGALEEAGFPDASFDVIHMYHLIEHVPDPIRMIRECYRILRPGGMVIIGTNNLGSLVHWWFKENYAQLDAPHHMFLFTPRTLRKVVERGGLSIVKLLTRGPWAAEIYNASWHLRQFGSADLKAEKLVPGARWFARLEKILQPAFKNIGDEIVLWAKKLEQ